MKNEKLKLILFLSLLLISSSLIAQTTIFTESMGSVTGTTTIATHEANNGFDNDDFTMTNGGATKDADIRNTDPSTGYSGASGLANVYFSSGGEPGFAIEGINAFGYTNLKVQFGYRKENSQQLPTLQLDYWNGTEYVNVPFTFNEASNAPVGWYLSPVIDLPFAAQRNDLRLRWIKTRANSTRIDDVVLTGTQATILNVTPDTLSGFAYIFGNGPSTSQSFVLSGVDLDGSDVTIEASIDFELSLDNSVWTGDTTLTSYDGSNTTLYIRLKEGLAIGSYEGSVFNFGGGADTQTVVLLGDVLAVPTLTVVPDTLKDFAYIFGNGPTTSQIYVLSGVDLDGSDVVITAPLNFELSLDNTIWSDDTTITAYSGADTTIYVRLKSGLAIGTYNGELTNSGGGATTVKVVLIGAVKGMTLKLKIYLQGAYR